MSTTERHILTTHADRVLTIEISRRAKKNAISGDMYRALTVALTRASTDPDIGAVFLRGQSDLFSAGIDIAELAASPVRQNGAGHHFLLALSSFTKPIVAAVGGVAIGVGCTLLLHCDLVLAGASARFRLPFVTMGLCPEAGSSLLLPQMAGQRLAAELMLLGDYFDAETAVRAGIVNRMVEDDVLIEQGAALALRLAHRPADAMQTTKALLKRSSGRSVLAAIAEEYPQFERLLASDEARGIARAFTSRMERDR